MSVISGETIEKLIQSKELILEPLDKECLQPASIDLRVGRRAIKSPVGETRGAVIDLAKEKKIEILPGQFASVLTLERLLLPVSICGRIGLRSFYTRRGLISFHGAQVDPGFSGYLVVPLVNVGPETITLEYSKPFSTLELNYLETASSKTYSGDYQDQSDFPADDINFLLQARTVSLAEIPSLRDDLTQLRSRFSSLENLHEDVTMLREDLEELLEDLEESKELKEEVKAKLRERLATMAKSRKVIPATEVARKLGLHW